MSICLLIAFHFFQYFKAAVLVLNLNWDLVKISVLEGGYPESIFFQASSGSNIYLLGET